MSDVYWDEYQEVIKERDKARAERDEAGRDAQMWCDREHEVRICWGKAENERDGLAAALKDAAKLEREACAKLAEGKIWGFPGTDNGAHDQACRDIADSIRARGDAK